MHDHHRQRRAAPHRTATRDDAHGERRGPNRRPRTARAPRWTAVRLAALALVGATVAAGCAVDRPIERLAGSTRYETATAVATWNCTLGCDGPLAIVVTTGTNFPDGLAAAALGDLVLTVAPTADFVEIDRAFSALVTDGDRQLTVGSITIIGGRNAVSDSVEAALRSWGPVTRVEGSDRFLTALAVAERVTQKPSFLDSSPRTAIIATGANFPDALAAGPLSECLTAPILLQGGGLLLTALERFIRDKNISRVYIVGGTAVVSADVEARLRDIGVDVHRLAGEGRAATAVAIAEEIASPRGCGQAPLGVVLVNGNTFADALAAGPMAAKAGSPILLVDKDAIPAATRAYLQRFESLTGTAVPIIAVGGTAVISETVVAQAESLVNPGVEASLAPNIMFATQTVTETSAVYIVRDGEPSTDVMKLTATDALPGADAEAWVVDFMVGPTAVQVDESSKVIRITDSFTGAYQDLVTLWNGSAAAAYFTAAAVAPDAASRFWAVTPVIAYTGFGTVTGSALARVTTVFDKALSGTTPTIGIYADAAATTALPLTAVPDKLLSSTVTTHPTGVAILVNEYLADVPGSLPTIGTSQVRVAAGDATASAGGLTNPRQLVADIISCAPQDPTSDAPFSDALHLACQALGIS